MVTGHAEPPMVVVVGSVNVDLIVGVSRLPRPGETVLGDRFTRQSGGKGANQAVAASRVGASVTMVGAVGDDGYGRDAIRSLGVARVDAAACHVNVDAHTGVALIVVDGSGENQIAVAPGANARLDGPMVEAQLARLEARPGAVCLLGFEVGDDALLTAARWATANGLAVVLNPAPARPVIDELAALSPILTPNEAEACRLSGAADPESAARILGARTRAPTIVTLGAAGALLTMGSSTEFIPALPVQAVDTTGAGDALNGILAAELARGEPVGEALRWATAGASLKTMHPGAQAGLPTREQIAALLP